MITVIILQISSEFNNLADEHWPNNTVIVTHGYLVREAICIAMAPGKVMDDSCTTRCTEGDVTLHLLLCLLAIMMYRCMWFNRSLHTRLLFVAFVRSLYCVAVLIHAHNNAAVSIITDCKK